jgi:hypothetical protein
MRPGSAAIGDASRLAGCTGAAGRFAGAPVGFDATGASVPGLAAASDSANACHADRRCGSLNDAIPLSQLLNVIGSIPAPVGTAGITDINKLRYKSQEI